MLADAEGQGVDTIAQRARPLPAARVIPGPVQVHEPCPQVPDCIAPENQHVVPPRCLQDRTVEFYDDLRRRAGPVRKMPAILGHLLRHVPAPSAKDVVGAEIMLQEPVAPSADFIHRLFHQ